jgi:methylthioribose-1-phosphate isomerase
LKVGAHHYHTIWLNEDGASVDIIDQRWLPHEFRIVTLRTVEDVAVAIRDMWVRGAPLIGVTAAYGVALAMAADSSDASLDAVWEKLHETRPTAINLRWALDECALSFASFRTANVPKLPTSARPRLQKKM